MVDLIGPSIGAGVVFIAAGLGWVLNSTRRTEGTARGVSALGRSLDTVRSDHGKRLDVHDEEILELRTNFVSRREFDEKMEATMCAINANYAHIKAQLDQQGRWLEYAVFNKKSAAPSIFTTDPK